MLSYTDNMELVERVKLTRDAQCNAQDSQLLTHARALLAIMAECERQLDVVKDTLMERRGFIDGVIWQINETTGTRNPVLVLENS